MASATSALAVKPIDVAAGLVFHQQKLLITQRPVGTHLAGLWEFPGGKREAGEPFEACLVRRKILLDGAPSAIELSWRELGAGFPG